MNKYLKKYIPTLSKDLLGNVTGYFLCTVSVFLGISTFFVVLSVYIYLIYFLFLALYLFLYLKIYEEFRKKQIDWLKTNGVKIQTTLKNTGINEFSRYIFTEGVYGGDL